MLVQFIASLIAVFCFSITLEVPKKFTMIVGIVGATGWIVYLLCIMASFSVVFSTFIAAFWVAIISAVLSEIFKAVTTIFFIPGILPLVPGVAMYKMVYAMINNNTSDIIHHLLQALLMAGSIALAIFITESLRKLKWIPRKDKVYEN